MKNLKRIISVCAAALLMVGLLGGCAGDKTTEVSESVTESTAAEKLSVVATIFPAYDFVRAVAGDKVDLTMLLAPGGEVHSYEPSPSDLIKIKNCDVFIYIGGEDDTWVEDTLAGIGNISLKTIAMTDCVNLVEEELVEGMMPEEEEEAGEDAEAEEEPEYDAHVWTSPVNAVKIVENIRDALCEADVANSGYYKSNAQSYIDKLNALDTEFRNIVANSARKTIVVADRFPLRYFVEEYGLDYSAAFVGCSNQTTVGLSTIKFLSDKVTENKIPTVFYIEFSSQEIADSVCEAAGCKKALFHSCHNVSREDFDNGVTYVELTRATSYCRTWTSRLTPAITFVSSAKTAPAKVHL